MDLDKVSCLAGRNCGQTVRVLVCPVNWPRNAGP